MPLSAAQLISQVYVGYYNRAPDAAGLNYWVGRYNAGMSLGDIAQSFSVQTESLNNYAYLANPNVASASTFLTAVYANLFNRAPDADGLAYWTAQLSSGKSTVGNAIINIISGAQDTAASKDLTTITNKMTAGLNWATTMANIAGAVYDSTAAASAKAIVAAVTSDAATVTAAATSTSSFFQNGSPGTTYTLTKGIDSVPGTSGADTINANLSGTAADNTLNALDILNGGSGIDTLSITDDTGGQTIAAGLQMSNIEKVIVRSAGAATIDLTGAGISGVTALKVTQATSATITAGSTTDVTVSGNSGAATVTGGASQTVTAVGAITLSGSKGAVEATDTKQGTAAIAIDDGTSVTLTTTSTNPNGTTGTITIGGTTAPSGAVVITDNLTNEAAAGGATADTTGGAITITGGKTVSVTETAAQGVMATASTNAKIVQGDVSVTGGSATSTVTVNQSAAVTAVDTKLAVTGVAEVDTVKFEDMSAGDTVTLGGVTLTAPTGGLKAKQVAAAFANLASGQLTGWSTGAVSGTSSDTVTFTSTSTSNTSAITDSGTSTTAVTITSKTAYVAAVKAAGVGGVDVGAVTIADPNQGTTKANTITSVVLNNYGASTVASDALTSVSLTNSSADAASGTFDITNVKATSLDLTVNGGAKGLGAITTGSTYTTLNVHTAGTNTKAVVITAAGVTALTVDGANVLDTTGSTFAALKTVKVSGAAGVKGDFSASTVTSVDVSASSGSNTVTIDATKATYAGGSGADTVTIGAVPTKAISGGDGVDTLVLNVAAATFSNPSSNAYITGFETLQLGASADGAYDATGFSSLKLGAVTAATTFNNVAAGTSLTFTADPGFATTYTLKNATGTSDSLALNLSKAGALALTGGVTASGIETVAISASDTTSGVAAGKNTQTLALTDTSLTTVTVTGNATLDLTTSSITSSVSKLTLVDASGMSGGLTYTTEGNVAVTVKGGASANHLTAGTGTKADVLIGGAAADTLTANAGLDTLTGGAGTDTFVVQTSGASLNVYTTITDAAAGDILNLADKGVETFTSAKVVLAGTATFQDYANAVVSAGGDASTDGAIGWFQYAGDTYVVESKHDGTATANFVNGTDLVVKLTGTIDLSTATLANVGGASPLLLIH